MEADSRQFLERLLTVPGVSGFEQRIQRVVREYAESFADDIRADLHGNLILSVNGNGKPSQPPLQLMYAGHADQIGLLVSHIDDDGFLYFQTVGGWDPQQLVGQRVRVWSRAEGIPGVIARKPIHLLEESDRKQVVNPKALWIDIGANSEEQARSLVRIGDTATLEMGSIELLNGLISAPALDNRSGLWVVVEALRRVDKARMACRLSVASTVQEEIGLRGAQTAAFSIAPQVGVAVDVTHATDCPEIDRKQHGRVRLGQGPVIVNGPNMNHRVSDLLESLAQENHLPYQRSALGRAASNDSNAVQVSRGGVATGVVAIPNRYMHSGVEVCALSDLDHAADLLARFAERAAAEEDFVPGM